VRTSRECVKRLWRKPRSPQSPVHLESVLELGVANVCRNFVFGIPVHVPQHWVNVGEWELSFQEGSNVVEDGIHGVILETFVVMNCVRN